MAPRKFQIQITIYDARDVARFVDLMRGTNGNALIRLYGDAPVNEHALWSFHAPRQYGGSDWIANASLREVHPVGSEMGDGKMKTVVRRGEGKINAVVPIEAAGPEPLAHVGGPLGSFANGGNVPSGSPWAPAAELQSTGCDRCDAGDQPNNMGWHGGGENATPCLRRCRCGAAANGIIHASAHPDSHDFVPATPIPPSRSGARWLADHPENRAQPAQSDGLRAFWTAQAEWSDATFGDEKTRPALGPLRHLRKEVDEAIESELFVTGGSAEEIGDCIAIALDAARRAGMSYDDVVAQVMAKLESNKKRSWPTTSPDAPAEHDRSGEINPVARQQALSIENSDRLAEKDREIEELKAKCHPLRCGHCSCFIESHGLEIDKCQRAACFPNYGPSMRAEIERLTVQVTELQIANTREVEARRAMTEHAGALDGKLQLTQANLWIMIRAIRRASDTLDEVRSLV